MAETATKLDMKNQEIFNKNAEINRLKEDVEKNKNEINKLQDQIESYKSQVQTLKNSKAELPKPETSSKMDSKDLDRFKEKYRREAENWAKEKRRLESKIRHITKTDQTKSTISSNISSNDTSERNWSKFVRL